MFESRACQRTPLDIVKCSVRVVALSALAVYMMRTILPGSTVTPLPAASVLQHTTPRATPSCPAMFTVDKGSLDAYWDSDTRYRGLSRELELLLRAVEVGDIAHTNRSSILAYPDTRLSLMHGALPYLPCKVREYGATGLGECSSTRAARGVSTWIAFAGDSNQRQKMHSFIAFLPAHLNYTFYLGKKEVNITEFTMTVAHHDRRPPTFDIIGRRPSSTTAPSTIPHPTTSPHTTTPSPQALGLYHHTFLNGNKVRGTNYSMYVLQDPLYVTTESDNGTSPQTLSKSRGKNKTDSHKSHNNKKSAFDQPLYEKDVPFKDYELRVTLVWTPSGSEMEHPTSRSGIKVTKLLDLAKAKAVPDVIVIGYGTWMLLMRENDEELVPFSELDILTRPILQQLSFLASRTTLLYWPQSRYRWFTFEHMNDLVSDKKEWWRNFLMTTQFNDSLNLLDYWLWHLIKGTGAWYWDSTLPLNLANLRECQRLYQAGLNTHPLYFDRWWNCFDVHHASYETNSVEIQMLLNLLCNKDMKAPKEYCCSGDS